MIDVSFTHFMASVDWLPEYVRGHGYTAFLSRLGSSIVHDIEQIITLGGLYSVVSFVAMLVTIWVMQITTSRANWRTKAGRIMWGKRLTLGIAACGMALNMFTPFIIPHPPWLSSIPVVIGVGLALLLHGIEFRLNYIRYMDEIE